MIGALKDGQRVINIDETWLSSTNFESKSWSTRGKINGRPKKELSTRVSLICAIDNLGSAYFAASTGTTDSEVFVTFLMSLVTLLELE